MKKQVENGEIVLPFEKENSSFEKGAMFPR